MYLQEHVKKKWRHIRDYENLSSQIIFSWILFNSSVEFYDGVVEL